MIDERAGLKRARKHHLTPLEGKTIAGIEHHIETLSLPRRGDCSGPVLVPVWYPFTYHKAPQDAFKYKTRPSEGGFSVCAGGPDQGLTSPYGGGVSVTNLDQNPRGEFWFWASLGLGRIL
jgi:hypothetical protein